MKFTEKQERRIASAIVAIITSISIIASVKALGELTKVIKIICVIPLAILAKMIKKDMQAFKDEENTGYNYIKYCRELEKEWNIRILDDEQRELIDGPENKIKMGFC